ncbi:hypothetical protein NM688_g150 [Phlebia brevispora]|uniref:Uncharacterized protein n=1 Tax=Phlebia brevispora TaxID=194682 RepID=A0ACC1TEV3_9APHY|nr:hypothetical protein NM688_g150 [Phlebia brevispora]
MWNSVHHTLPGHSTDIAKPIYGYAIVSADALQRTRTSVGFSPLSPVVLLIMQDAVVFLFYVMSVADFARLVDLVARTFGEVSLYKASVLQTVSSGHFIMSPSNTNPRTPSRSETPIRSLSPMDISPPQAAGAAEQDPFSSPLTIYDTPSPHLDPGDPRVPRTPQRPRWADRNLSDLESPTSVWNDARLQQDLQRGERRQASSKPFIRPNIQHFATLFDLALSSLPMPPPYKKDDKGFMSSTKTLNQAELSMEVSPDTVNDVLQEVVYAGTMLLPIENIIEQRLSKIWLDWTDEVHRDFVGSVSPWHTTSNLPPSINSEKDVEDWGTYATLAPAARLLDSIIHNAVRPRPSNTAQVLPVHKPNVTSSDGEDGVIPDSIVIDEKGDIMAVVEFKSESVFDLVGTGGLPIFDLIAGYHKINGVERRGRAMKFLWPKVTATKVKGDKTKFSVDEEPDIQTKLLIQVWTQMVIKKVDYAKLSSFNTSIFFYRKDQRLYMSQAYDSSDQLILATLSWMMLAFGLAKPEDMHLPEVDNTWYDNDDRLVKAIESARLENISGIVVATMPALP